MSAPLLVLIPPTLLAIVLWLCFVGCTNDYQDFDILPFTQYSTVTILPSPGLAAYWPLGEPAQSVKAVDLKGGHDGDYLSQVFPDDPAFQGAAAPGTLTLQSPGIVAGDTVAPHDATSPRTTCMLTNGGYVSVPFDAALNPTKAEGFTLEAWVRVEWTADAAPAFRVIMTSLESVGGFKGYGLFTTSDNHWAALVGNGGVGGTGLTQAIGGAILFETTNHLVASYDGSDLKLYVNGEQNSPTTPADYHPAAANPLYIGVGRPDLPEPHVPFNGEIQCVAIYKGALPLETVIKHYQNGNGA
jgi:hypothetical protein